MYRVSQNVIAIIDPPRFPLHHQNATVEYRQRFGKTHAVVSRSRLCCDQFRKRLQGENERIGPVGVTHGRISATLAVRGPGFFQA
jgi:hypothetical protein